MVAVTAGQHHGGYGKHGYFQYVNVPGEYAIIFSRNSVQVFVDKRFLADGSVLISRKEAV